jgi:DNA-binding NarL/FixJ family response regulator
MPSAVLELPSEAPDPFHYISSLPIPDNSESAPGRHLRISRRLSANVKTIVVIESRTLMREFLERSLSSLDLETGIVAFSSVEKWLESPVDEKWPAPLILLNSSSEDSARLSSDLQELRACDPKTPVIVLSDDESRVAVIKAIEMGARGYIPTSFPLHSMAHILTFVREGGVFIPVSCLNSPSAATDAASSLNSSTNALFTGRQASVVAALQRGKPNKIIAYELNMCESTVKVHVRAIMKKMKARNRTEVAVRLSEMRSEAHS